MVRRLVWGANTQTQVSITHTLAGYHYDELLDYADDLEPNAAAICKRYHDQLIGEIQPKLGLRRAGVAQEARAGQHNQQDFVQGEWPAALKQSVADQASRLDDYKAHFARNTFGEVGPDQLKRAQFVLIGAPGAAVHAYLLRREPPPPLVDELVRVTYYAVVAAARAAASDSAISQ
jgi:hypothetical protein